MKVPPGGTKFPKFLFLIRRSLAGKAKYFIHTFDVCSECICCIIIVIIRVVYIRKLGLSMRTYSMKRQRSYRGIRAPIRGATMVSAWYPPTCSVESVLDNFKCCSRVSEMYVWLAEFDEVHCLLIFSKPCEMESRDFPGMISVEAIPTWQHGYRREQAERHPGVVHWSRNAMEVE